jgi:uncharacterized membrane protein
MMTKHGTVYVIRFVNLVFAGVFAGFLVAALVIELTLRNYGASVYIQVRHVELAHLDELASATLLPALMTTVVLTIIGLRARGRGRLLTLSALVGLVVVLATTLAVNLPINHDQLSWNVHTPPPDWASVRDRWQIAHAVRTVAALAAFGCLSAAALVNGRRTRADVTSTPRMAADRGAISSGQETALHQVARG